MRSLQDFIDFKANVKVMLKNKKDS